MATSVKFDTLRSLGFASISGTYAAVGIQCTHLSRVICITNNTDGDMIFSTDGINDMLFLAASSFKLFDLQTNKEEIDRKFVLPIGTQFYVKQSTAPSKGAVYIENIYG